MAKVHSVALVIREVSERLSLAGAERLLAAATKISEGQLLPDGHYFGSTMLTIDLGVATPIVAAETRPIDSRPPAAFTALRLSRLMSKNDAFIDRVKAIANEDANAQARSPLLDAELEVRLRSEGRRIFIDVDIEARCARQPLSSLPL